MGQSKLTNAAWAVSGTHYRVDGFRFLAFKQRTGEVLSHGDKAIFALERADLLAPNEAIEVLDAGVAGENLWQNQTGLKLAQRVVDLLATPWGAEQPQSHFQTSR